MQSPLAFKLRAAYVITLLLSTLLIYSKTLAIYFVPAVLALTVAYFLASAYVQYASLNHRAQADIGPFWDVFCNDVQIGRIADSDYATALLLPYADPRVYMQQLGNGLRVVLTLAGHVLIGVPIIAFWALILLAIGSPDTLAAGVDNLHSARSIEVVKAVSPFLAATLGVLVVCLGFMLFFGWSAGFRNKFKDASSAALRVQCSAPSTGNIYLKAAN